MKINRILFPTDFSNLDEAALKMASVLAAESHARLYIVHVYDIRNTSAAMDEDGFMKAATLHEEQHDAWERLTTIVPLIRGVRCEYELLVGTPVIELLQFARGTQIDLIVMSSHGRSGLRRLLMGSIAEDVMRSAKCPVLVAKRPAGKSSQVKKRALHAAHA